MKRIDAIKNIMDTVTENDIVISSCGHISREVYHVKDRARNFYVMGSMGCTLPVATGIAICKPELKVVVIVGDGECLIDLGNLALINKLQKENKVKNLKLFIMDNNKYSSTGGQPTISDAVEFRLLCDCKVLFVSDGCFKAPRIDLPHEKIKERFIKNIY